MFFHHVESHISIDILKEDFRKLGVNFITAGVVGVFVNHYVGSMLSNMFWASISITSVGMVALYLGLRKKRR